MKKGLLYLFMFVMGTFAFTACSDDDDPNWQKLPEEISGENLDIQVNGVATSGTVTFKATGEDAAVLQLNGVIPGCDVVKIDVEMVEQSDGTFTFTGSQEVEGIEVRSEETVTPKKYMVDANGSVSITGKLKANLNITLELASLNGEKVYTGNTLKLSYSDRELAGKQVIMQVSNGQSATLSLQGIVPGEPAVSISDIALSADGYKCNFTGNATTTAGTQIAYKGTVLGDTLTLSLNATLSTAELGGINGTWDIFSSIEKENKKISHSPAYFDWVSSYISPDLGLQSTTMLSESVRLIASHLVAEVLHNVTFGKDGTVTAQYYPELSLSVDDPMKLINSLVGDEIEIPADRQWKTSPKNLAFWYVKDNLLYIIPDIPMILKQVAEDGNSLDFGGLDINALLKSLQTMTGEEIKELLSDFLTQYEIDFDISSLEPATIKQIVGWLSTGIPLKYEVKPNNLVVSVDQEMVKPFMEQLLLPMIPALNTVLKEMMETMYPGQGETMYMLMAAQFFGVMDLEELNDIWKNTSAFNLGLEFKN